MITTAWHVEAFARTKRLPDLERLLKSDGRAERYKSNDEILAGFAALQATGAAVTITEIEED